MRTSWLWLSSPSATSSRLQKTAVKPAAPPTPQAPPPLSDAAAPPPPRSNLPGEGGPCALKWALRLRAGGEPNGGGRWDDALFSPPRWFAGRAGGTTAAAAGDEGADDGPPKSAPPPAPLTAT